jgi:hypothetical protein
MSESYPFAGDQCFDWTGEQQNNLDSIIYTSGDVGRYNYFSIGVTGDGSIKIEVTLNGISWYQAHAILLDGSQVMTIGSGQLGLLVGKFKCIRVVSIDNNTVNAHGTHGCS